MLGSFLQASIIKGDFKTVSFFFIFPNVWSQYLPSHCCNPFPCFLAGASFLHILSYKSYTLLPVIRVYQISVLLGCSSTKKQCSVESVIWTAALWRPVCTELHLTLTAFLILNGSGLRCQGGSSKDFPWGHLVLSILWLHIRYIVYFWVVKKKKKAIIQGDVLTCALPIKAVETRIWVSHHWSIFCVSHH